MLDDETAKPLIDRGWKRDGDALAWQGEQGTSMRLEVDERRIDLVVFFDGAQVLGYEMQVERDLRAALMAALAAETAALDRMQHAGFSRAVAVLARDAVVTTTEGRRVKPRIDDDQLAWDLVAP